MNGSPKRRCSASGRPDDGGDATLRNIEADVIRDAEGAAKKNTLRSILRIGRVGAAFTPGAISRHSHLGGATIARSDERDSS